MIEKPMLALSRAPDLEKVSFPVLMSPKLDGIRCLVIDGKAVTRRLKPVPNDYVREWVEACMPDGFDGELLLSDMTADYNLVQSAIMSKNGEPDFIYAVFDWWEEEGIPFHARVASVHRHRELFGLSNNLNRFFAVPHVEIKTVDEALAAQQEWEDQGFEGAMIRAFDGPYKFGRSTEREGYLLKLKKFVDEEAVVIGVQELMKNDNDLSTDCLGHAKRSSAKDGKVLMNTMGALRCKTLTDDVEFGLASGFSAELRQQIWDAVTVYKGVATHAVIGAVVKFKHQAPPKGRKKGQVPRGPAVFLGFRDVNLD